MTLLVPSPKAFRWALRLCFFFFFSFLLFALFFGPFKNEAKGERHGELRKQKEFRCPF